MVSCWGFFFGVCFFTPSQPLTASFISSSFPSFHSLPFWLDRPVLDLRSTDWSELYMFVTCNEPFSDQQWTCVCSPGFLKKKNPQTGQKGREVIWGEENSWLLFLSRFSSFGITDLFQTFFPPFGQSRSWRECCSVPSWMLPMYTISCAKSPGWKTKTDGFWRKREVGGDWSEGLKGTDGKWGGECMLGWGGMWWDESHTWFLLLWLLRFSCLTLLCNHDQYKV